MSVLVELTSLSDEQISTISSSLTLQPRDKDSEKYAYMRNGHVKKEKPIVMYLHTKTTVSIPYNFACNLFEERMNTSNEHVKIITKIDEEWTPKFELILREDQKEYLPECLDIMNKNDGCVIIGLPPATGKTIMGIWLAHKKRLATCILVPIGNLQKQWENTIKKCIPELSDSIWIVGDKNILPDGVVPAFTICMNQRYSKIPEYLRKSIGTIIIDEAHKFCTPTNVKCLLFFEPKYIIAETATLERNNGMHEMMYKIVGDKGLFKVSTKPYNVYRIDTNCEVEEKYGDRGLIFGSLIEDLSNVIERNEIAIDIVRTNHKHKFIILTRLTEHVNTLNCMFEEEKIESDTLFGSKKKYKNTRVTIGTIPKMGTGFDEASFCDDFDGINADVLIIMLSIKGWQIFEQIRGRVMRSKQPIVIWLVDANSTCKKHFKGMQPWFDETNASIIHVKSYKPGCIVL
jgi:superfamily II DNA or RNA helicase